MIVHTAKLYTKDGYVSICRSKETLLVPYSGDLIRIHSEVGDAPFVCTPCTVFVCKKKTDETASSITETPAHDIRRGMYLGCPVVTDVPISFIGNDDILLRQMRCVAAGHPRRVIGKTLDDVSCHSDAHLQDDMVWYKIHDIEETRDHEELLYTVPRPVIINNIMVVA